MTDQHNTLLGKLFGWDQADKRDRAAYIEYSTSNSSLARFYLVRMRRDMERAYANSIAAIREYGPHGIYEVRELRDRLNAEYGPRHD